MSAPAFATRVAGAALGLLGFLALLLLAAWIADNAGLSLDGQKIGRAAAPVGLGAALAGWRWPGVMLRPFALLARALRRQ